MLQAEARYRLIKAAAGDQQTFETSLASIGRAVINSRAPAISKNEIGFQVLDADDDNTRAVGAFGYKIGGRIYYVPMFYRDGVTKGVEQLRDPKRKRTVPLTDNWVNKLTVEKGDDPPKRTSRSALRDTSQPSLWQLKYSPMKWASAMPEWAKEARTDLARVLTHGGDMVSAASDVDLVKLAGEYPVLMSGVQAMVSLYPWFADALVRYHGTDKIAAAVEQASKPKPPKRTTVKLASYDRPRLSMIRVTQVSLSAVPTSRLSDFSPSEFAELSAGRNAYSDKRADDEVAVTEARWDGQAGAGTVLSNPGECGVQKVLGADMELHDCAVLFPLTAWEPRPGDCLVVRVKDGAWARVDRNAVWVLGNTGVDLDANVEWHSKLESADTAPTDTAVAAVYLAAGKKLYGSVPFRVDSDGGVRECGCGSNRRSYWAQAGTTTAHDPGREEYDAGKKVRLSDSAARLVVMSNCLYMPGRDKTRFVELGYDKQRLKLANGDDPDVFLFPNFKASSAGADTLHVTNPRSGLFAVTGKLGSAEFDSQADAEAFLVETHRLRVPDARSLVEGARAHKAAHAAVRYPAIKAADDLERNRLPTDWPNAPMVVDPAQDTPGGFADDIVPTETANASTSTIQDLSEQAGDRERYRTYPQEAGVQVPMPGIGNSGDEPGASQGIDADDIDTVASAARSGSKELFDTAALAALVKRTRLDAIITKVTRSATTWMNAAADALGHLYWNADEWAERFGQSEVGPMEDQLRDHFEGVGEMCLNLQEKAVDGGRDFGLLPEIDTVDSTDAAGA